MIELFKLRPANDNADSRNAAASPQDTSPSSNDEYLKYILSVIAADPFLKPDQVDELLKFAAAKPGSRTQLMANWCRLRSSNLPTK